MEPQNDFTKTIFFRFSPALIDAIVDASAAYTLAAAVVEPPITGGPHRLTCVAALVPGHALLVVSHSTVESDFLAVLQRTDLLLGHS